MTGGETKASVVENDWKVLISFPYQGINDVLIMLEVRDEFVRLSVQRFLLHVQCIYRVRHLSV